MNHTGGPAKSDDQFDLQRFITAQDNVYRGVIAEIRSGGKKTHWMWFVFPQIDGLGFSTTTKRYSIKSIGEAQQYLQHPVLGKRLRECAEALLMVSGRSIAEIFGAPDDLKLQSSMTLFASVSESGSVFFRVLEKYFKGKQDTKTLRLLENWKL